MVKRQDREPAPLSEVLAKLLQRRGYARPLSLEQARAAWGRVAGDDLSERCRVAQFRDGILTMEVSSAALRYELEAFRGAALLSRLQADAEAPPVQRLVFKVSS